MAAATVLAVSITGCNSSGSTTAQAGVPMVDVAPVVARQIQTWDDFNGRVSAVNAADMRPRVSGYITKVAYSEGSDVRKGDLLFVIDQRPYRATLKAARAQLERAKAAELNARLQDERAQSLLPTAAISLEYAEQKRAARDQSVAELHAAEAAVETAELDLEFTEVRAPFDGRTGRAQVTVGNMAEADRTVLTSVVSQDPVYVYFSPDEQSYLRYLNTVNKQARGATYPVHVGLASDSVHPYSGEVKFFDNQVDPSTGTIQVRAVVPNPDRLFTPGLYARVRFAARQGEQALLTTDLAVMRDQDRAYVYVLGAGNKAERREVKLGKKVEGLRVIESGVTARDSIIVAGLQKIYAPDMVVEPQVIQLEASDSTQASSLGTSVR